MKEKRTAENTGVHGKGHERWVWFNQADFNPPQEDVDIVREVFYQDCEYAVYDQNFLLTGRIRAGNLPKAMEEIRKRGHVIGKTIYVIPLPMPQVDPSELPDDEPPSGWNSAWGEDPRE